MPPHPEGALSFGAWKRPGLESSIVCHNSSMKKRATPTTIELILTSACVVLCLAKRSVSFLLPHSRHLAIWPEKNKNPPTKKTIIELQSPPTTVQAFRSSRHILPPFFPTSQLQLVRQSLRHYHGISQKSFPCLNTVSATVSAAQNSLSRKPPTGKERPVPSASQRIPPFSGLSGSHCKVKESVSSRLNLVARHRDGGEGGGGRRKALIWLQ